MYYSSPCILQQGKPRKLKLLSQNVQASKDNLWSASMHHHPPGPVRMGRDQQMAATRGKKGVQGQKNSGQTRKTKKRRRGRHSRSLAHGHAISAPARPENRLKAEEVPLVLCAGNAVDGDSHFHDTHTQHKARRGAHLTKSSCSRKQLAPTPTRVLWWYTDERKKQKKARLAWGKRRRYTRSSAHPATRRMAHNWSEGACVHCGRKLMLA